MGASNKTYKPACDTRSAKRDPEPEDSSYCPEHAYHKTLQESQSDPPEHAYYKTFASFPDVQEKL